MIYGGKFCYNAGMARPEIGSSRELLASVVAREVDPSLFEKQKEIGNKIREIRAKAVLAENVFMKGFFPDAVIAKVLADSIASNYPTIVPFDPQSLGKCVTNIDEAGEYMQSFNKQGSSTDYSFPTLTFPAAPVLTYDGESHYVNTESDTDILVPTTASSFKPNIILPTLIDSSHYTVRELEGLEYRDPGHVSWLYKIYQNAKNDNTSFESSFIVPMIAVLPTGNDYVPSFSPEISTREGDDSRLIFRGELNKFGLLHLSEAPFPDTDVSDINDQSRVSVSLSEPNKLGVILFPPARTSGRGTRGTSQNIKKPIIYSVRFITPQGNFAV